MSKHATIYQTGGFTTMFVVRDDATNKDVHTTTLLFALARAKFWCFRNDYAYTVQG